MSLSQRRKTMMTLFCVMFLASVTENIKGIIIPQLRTRFWLSATDISYMLTSASIAYIMATFFAGNLVNRWGQRRIELLALWLMLISCLEMAWAPDFLFFIIGMVLLNIGLALNGVILNSAIPLLAIESKSKTVNRLHFMYGLGATMGQSLAALALGQGFHYPQIFISLALPLIILSLASRKAQYPQVALPELDDPQLSSHPYRDRRFYLLTLAMGLYIFAEIGLGNWLVDYLHVTQDMAESQAGQYISLFFLALALGRFFGGPLVDRLGAFPSLIIACVSGASCVILGLMIGGPAYYLISLAGLCYSIVFPTAVVLISEIFHHDIAKITGQILTFNSLGSMIYNQAVGWTTDHWGFQRSIYLMPIAALLSALLFYLLWHGQRKIAAQAS